MNPSSLDALIRTGRGALCVCVWEGGRGGGGGGGGEAVRGYGGAMAVERCLKGGL